VRTSLVVGSALLVALGGAALAVKPLVRATLVSEAERRGLVLDPGQVSLGLGTIELHGATLVPRDDPFLKAGLRQVRLRIGLTAPRLRAVEFLGGHVRLQGSLEEVEKGIGALRSPQAGPSAPRSAEGRFVVVRDIDVDWDGALGEDDRQSARGLALDAGPGGIQLGANWIGLRTAHSTLEIAGAELQSKGAAPGARFQSARASEARITLKDAPPAPELVSNASAKPGALPPSTLTTASPSKSGNSALHKVDGNGDGQGLLARFPLNPELPPRLAAILALLQGTLAKLPQSSSIDRMWVFYERDGERLQLGPSRLELALSPQDLRIQFEPGQGADGTPLALQLTLPRDSSDLRLDVRGGPVSLATLGIAEGSFGLEGVKEAELSGAIQAALNPNQVRFSGYAEVKRLRYLNPRVAPGQLYVPSLRWAGTGRFYLDGSFLEADEGEVDLGQAKLTGNLGWRRTEEHAELSFHLRAPEASCQAMLDATPRGLLGPIEAVRVSGTFGLELTVDADTRKLSEMGVGFQLQNRCKVTATPSELDPARFKRVFSRQVPGPGNMPITVDSGFGSANWTSYDEIARHFETALLVTEDGRFFRHGGFDERAIESSIKDNVRAGKFVRGASTLSMQLAKNLYLERNKTLSRKLQEAVLTLVLEQAFDKVALLELYMNVVELGPGVYGVREAARYYFNTTPAELTTAQCFFLASVLPAPKRQYFAADGTLREGRKEHIQRLLQIAFARERLSQGELDLALKEELRFGQPGSPRAVSEGSSASDEGVEGGSPSPSSAPAHGFGAPPLHTGTNGLVSPAPSMNAPINPPMIPPINPPGAP